MRLTSILAVLTAATGVASAGTNPSTSAVSLDRPHTATSAASSIPESSLSPSAVPSGKSENSTSAAVEELPVHLQDALEKIRQAQAEQGSKNADRYNNPLSNRFRLRPAEPPGFPEPLVAPEVEKSAVKVGEIIAKADPSAPIPGQNSTKGLHKRAGEFWMESIPHTGTVPIGAPANYKVFRNVKTYGAKGDGVTDDTAAINLAISDNGRCGNNCNSSTVVPALVYFPSGTYLVSSSIISYYNTQLVGNPNDMPTIRGSNTFVGLGVISSDVYIPGASGAEWYINQNNFLRQIRNFNIDMRQLPNVMQEQDVKPAGIHWQVAQATSLQNIRIIMSTDPATTHVGIFMENGSGGFMSDVYFTGGKIGAFLGNQQFTIRNFNFRGCQTAVHMLWDWAFTMKGFKIDNCQVGFEIASNAGASSNGEQDGSQGTGSFALIDSSISNTPVGIKTLSPIADGTTTIFLENLKLAGVGTALQSVSAAVVNGGSYTLASWASGNAINDITDKPGTGSRQQGGPLTQQIPKPAMLMKPDGSGWFEKSKPQYAELPASSFWDVKARFGAKADGRSDDTAALNRAFAETAAAGAIAYIPHGVYMITDTVLVPKGARIVGEVWPQIIGAGAKFQDMGNPRVMVKVGNEGDVGMVELSDLMFTVRGPTAGAILMEWNIKQSSQGSAAMWDCHFRVGGAIGSQLQAVQCPKEAAGVDPKCIAASLLMHNTRGSSGYFENIWAWTADHDLDRRWQDQISVYVGRGWLIESQGPTWLYGTASEHNVLYQYQFQGAKNLFLGMIQTESPYYQPSPLAPAPFAVIGSKKRDLPLGTHDGGEPNGAEHALDKAHDLFARQDGKSRFAGDPTFGKCADNDSACKISWALRMKDSTDVHMYGSGMYSWFSKYSQACLHTPAGCQSNLVDLDDTTSTQVRMHNTVTVGADNMVNAPWAGKIKAMANKNGFASSLMAWSANTAVDQLEKRKGWARDDDAGDRNYYPFPRKLLDARLVFESNCDTQKQSDIREEFGIAFDMAYNIVIRGTEPADNELWRLYFGDPDGPKPKEVTPAWGSALKALSRMLLLSWKDMNTWRGEQLGRIGQRDFSDFPYNSYLQANMPIRVACGGAACSFGSGQGIQAGQVVGAHATGIPNTESQNPLTFPKMEVCDPWWAYKSYKEIMAFPESELAEAINLKSRAQILLHEMCHFHATAAGGSYIDDLCLSLKDPFQKKGETCPQKKPPSRPVYGPKLAQALAKLSPNLAAKNADNYAYFAISYHIKMVKNLSPRHWDGEDITPTPTLGFVSRPNDKDDQFTKSVCKLTEAVGQNFVQDCLAATMLSPEDRFNEKTISTSDVTPGRDNLIGWDNSCVVSLNPNNGASCAWRAQNLMYTAENILGHDCGGISGIARVPLDPTEPPLGSACGATVEIFYAKFSIVGDAWFTYDSGSTHWTGKNRWYVLPFTGKTGDQWCDDVATTPVSGPEIRDGEKLGDFPWGTGRDMEGLLFNGRKCNFANTNRAGYVQAEPGSIVGWLECEGMRRGVCRKVAKPGIYPDWKNCGSASDQGKRHMQFVFAECEW